MSFLSGPGGAVASSALPANVRSVTGATTAAVGDLILANSTSGVFTVTLPSAPVVGALVTVKKTDSSANAVNVAPAGTGTVDGFTTASIATAQAGAVLEHVGSDAWRVVAVTTTGGANGKDGNTIWNGPGAPAAGVGVNGDFYIDTTAWAIYGPKAAGAWPGSGTSLIGPAGGGMTNPMTTASDLILGGVSGAPARLAKGINGQFLGVSGGVVGWLGAPVATLTDLQIFTTPGVNTWTKPVAFTPQTVDVIVICGGGGGGGGRKVASATAGVGGGGGGGGGMSFGTIPASSLGATVNVQVGAGGTGGAGATAASTSGSAGGNAGASYFGASLATASLGVPNPGGGLGGGAGSGGQGSGGSSQAIFPGGGGGSASSAGNVGPAGTAAFGGGGGGGSGGGVNTGAAANAGGPGAANYASGATAGGAAGAVNTNGSAGGSAATNAGIPGGGGGGGGGCVTAATNGGNGGNGGFPGGGGGGGGAALDTAGTAGNGGNGGGGLVIVVSRG